MKDKKFQMTMIIMVSVLLLIVIIGFTMKKQKSEYGTSVSFMGKPVYKNKELKANLQKANDETKKAISLSHGTK